MKLILASASPARLHLLKNIGIVPNEVLPADVDETPLKAEKPSDYVLRVAIAKAQKVAQLHPHTYILAADTTAALGLRIIGKPDDANHARQILRDFSGKRHKVHTGVCLITPQGELRTRLVTTTVKFACLSPQDIEDYIASGEWQGKAGGFSIQGRGSGFIEWVQGSVSSVIGLPLAEVRNLLKGCGYTSS